MKIFGVLLLLFSALFISVVCVARVHNRGRICSTYTNGPVTRRNPKMPLGGDICITDDIDARHPKVLARIEKKDHVGKAPRLAEEQGTGQEEKKRPPKKRVVVKYKIQDGKGLRNMLSPSEYHFNCFFDNHRPPYIIRKEHSKLACGVPEQTYLTLTMPAIPEPYTHSENSTVRSKDARIFYTPSEHLYESVVGASDAWLWVRGQCETMIQAIDQLCTLNKESEQYTEPEVLKCLAVGAMVYDMARVDLLDKVQFSVSRHRMLLEALESYNPPNTAINQMAAVHFRSEAYSIRKAFMLFDKIHNLFIKVPDAMNKKSDEWKGKIRIVMKGLASREILEISEAFSGCTRREPCLMTPEVRKMFFFVDFINRPYEREHMQSSMEYLMEKPLETLFDDTEITENIGKRLARILGQKPVKIVLVRGKKNTIYLDPFLDYLKNAKAILRDYSNECIDYSNAYLAMMDKMCLEDGNLCPAYPVETSQYEVEARVRNMLALSETKSASTPGNATTQKPVQETTQTVKPERAHVAINSEKSRPSLEKSLTEPVKPEQQASTKPARETRISAMHSRSKETLYKALEGTDLDLILEEK
ncbi:uncharacterized protein NEMAJ01_0657 [Nematocida major]|uniref:uncharacterized protein n=1 Tax=Nematocida major TaxID=1912982 RepID=UPI0020078858|nr:uncharacterized protein NEMAJ01_0657 [Nematocida major]KAH9385761.1 hypothetical protein NEMAJ01_0657 [Nematocida major]